MIPSEQQEWGGRAPFEQEETSGRSRSNRLLQLIGGWEKKGAQKTNTTGEGLTANLGWSSFSIKMSSLPLINIHNPGRKWGKAALGPSFPRCLPAEVNTLIRNKIHERKGVGFVSPGPWSSAASCSRLFSSSVLVWFCKRSQTALLSAEKWLSLWLNCFTLIGAVRRVCTIIVYNCWASVATITLYEYMSRLKDKPHWGSVVQMRLTDALLQLLLTLLCCKVRWLNYVIRAHTYLPQVCCAAAAGCWRSVPAATPAHPRPPVFALSRRAPRLGCAGGPRQCGPSLPLGCGNIAVPHTPCTPAAGWVGHSPWGSGSSRQHRKQNRPHFQRTAALTHLRRQSLFLATFTILCAFVQVHSDILYLRLGLCNPSMWRMPSPLKSCEGRFLCVILNADDADIKRKRAKKSLTSLDVLTPQKSSPTDQVPKDIRQRVKN